MHKLAIIFNTESELQVLNEDDDIVLNTFFMSLAEFDRALLAATSLYGTEDFGYVALHGPSHMTSKVLDRVNGKFKNALVIVDGKD